MNSQTSQPLTFIQANNLFLGNKSKEKHKVKLCMSGTAEPLMPFIKGEISRYGLFPEVDFIPFGTLAQHLNQDCVAQKTKRGEVWLLFPWDIIRSLDWRMGGRTVETSIDALIGGADRIVEKVVQKIPNQLVYVDATIPPVGVDASSSDTLRYFLKYKLSKAGAKILSGDVFSLSKYLTTGFPLEGKSVGAVSFYLMNYLSNRSEFKKVIVTDLDNTLWGGVAAEDGPKGIDMGPDERGYKFFLYQSYLSQLQSLGVVVAAVTRNSEKVINDVFELADPLFKKEYFSAIIASYDSKSAQIAELSRAMNLGIDGFVFVDDNIVEIEEVGGALPKVTSLQFPSEVSEMPLFFQKLSELFNRKVVTSEDRSRTEKYKLMLAGVTAKKSDSHDISVFLKSLRMKLHVFDRSRGDWARALQLINKTNQFNANGNRMKEQDVLKVISGGGRVYTARLADSIGDHGEVISCLIDSQGRVLSLVMSCRVFQRKIEFSFLAWLIFNSGIDDLSILVKKTDRNEPFIRFLSELGFDISNQDVDVCLSSSDLAYKLNAESLFAEVLYGK